MNLLHLFATISASLVNTLGVAHAAPKVVSRSEPNFSNFCGWFKHNDSRSGWALANDECKNFEWKNPGDEEIESSFKRPVYTLQNVHCGLCFVWEERGCQGSITYMGGPNATEGTRNPTTFMHFKPSLSYFCKPPGWHLGDPH